MGNEIEQMYVVTQLRAFRSDQDFQGAINDWLTLSQLMIEPNQFYFAEEKNMETFDSQKIQAIISQISLTNKGEQRLVIQGSLGEFAIDCYEGKLRERLLISFPLYQARQDIIVDYVNQRMEKNGLYAYSRPIAEYLSYNTQSLADRAEEGIEFPVNLPKMYDQEKEVIVDCSQLVGYDSYYKGLCFTACWMMWYSDAYYHLIPKEAFLDLQQVEKISPLANEVLQVTLYENPLEWQHPTNVNFQLTYREQLGFDQLEWSNGVGVLREPSTEFIKIGNNTQMIQYQNNSLQPTVKSQASHFTTRLYHYQSNYYIEGRRFGQLNNRAYFPWRDKEKKIMLAYWILNPSYMLDQGNQAYEFYIKQYIKAAISDEETKHFRAVLRFYLPAEVLSNLSVEELIQHFDQIHVKVKSHQRKKPRLEIETEDLDLFVEFTDVKELEQPKKARKKSPLTVFKEWLKEQKRGKPN